MKKKTSKRIVNKQVLPEYPVKKSQRLIDFLMETFPGKSRNNVKSLLSRKLVLIDGAPISQFDFEVVITTLSILDKLEIIDNLLDNAIGSLDTTKSLICPPNWEPVPLAPNLKVDLEL